MKARVNKTTIQTTQGDILSLSTDAIVIAADTTLHPSTQLLQRTGDTILSEIQAIGSRRVGDVAITNAGQMDNTRKIIHAIGPRWGEPGARANLGLVTWRCLEIARDHALKSIAVPPISIGTLGYPVEACAKIMFDQIIDFTFEDAKKPRKIVLCLPDKFIQNVFDAELKRQVTAFKESGDAFA